MSLEPKKATRVLVTGGSGFIGTNLCQYLEDNGYEWINLDAKAPRIEAHLSHWVEVDIMNRANFEAEFSKFKPEIVFHLAARTDLRGNSVDEYKINFEGTETLISCVVNQNPQPTKVMFFSTRLVFEITQTPNHLYDYSATTAYGKSKIKMEEVIKTHSEKIGNWTIVRPTSIWGPWFETPYKDFFDQVKSGRFLKIKGINPQKSFGYVENLVLRAIHIATENQSAFSKSATFLADLKPLKLNEWSDMISKAFRRRNARSVSYALIKAIAVFGDVIDLALPGKFPLTSFRLRNLTADMVYDLTELEHNTFPDPIPLHEAVSRTVDWYEKNA